MQDLNLWIKYTGNKITATKSGEHLEKTDFKYKDIYFFSYGKNVFSVGHDCQIESFRVVDGIIKFEIRIDTHDTANLHIANVLIDGNNIYIENREGSSD